MEIEAVPGSPAPLGDAIAHTLITELMKIVEPGFVTGAAVRIQQAFR